MSALIFDTETTGLLPNWFFKRNQQDYTRDDCIREFPHIVQISFILFNCDTLQIVESHDYIIKVPDDVIISKKSTEIHGIDRQICNEKGVDLKYALNKFESLYNTADIIVAHNMQFDGPVVQINAIRNNLGHIIGNKVKSYCTMKNTTKLCNIKAVNTRGEYKKFPSQSELHVKLFGTAPSNLHNSYHDILICLRCYIMLIKNTDICEHNDELKNIYSKLVKV